VKDGVVVKDMLREAEAVGGVCRVSEWGAVVCFKTNVEEDNQTSSFVSRLKPGGQTARLGLVHSSSLFLGATCQRQRQCFSVKPLC
jgi:hypothetical protein